MSADVNILNNAVMGNYGDTAIDVQYVSTPISANRIVDNFTASGLRLRSGSGVNVTIANNVIARSGRDTVWLEDTSVAPLTTTFVNNTIVGSNTGVGVFAGFVVSKLWLTNTIVANHTT